MWDYICKDDKGNEIIVVSFSILAAREQAIERFKKKFNSELIGCKADYSKIIQL